MMDVVVVQLDTLDAALYLNGIRIYTLNTEDAGEAPAALMTKMTQVLGIEGKTFEIPVSSLDWTWSEVDDYFAKLAKQAGPVPIAFPLCNSGQNPNGYRAVVERCGDKGIYDEVRIGVLTPENTCVADVLLGLTQAGEVRVLVTTEGDGDNGHQVAVYPERSVEQSFDDMQ